MLIFQKLIQMKNTRVNLMAIQELSEFEMQQVSGGTVVEALQQLGAKPIFPETYKSVSSPFSERFDAKLRADYLAHRGGRNSYAVIGGLYM